MLKTKQKLIVKFVSLLICLSLFVLMEPYQAGIAADNELISSQITNGTPSQQKMRYIKSGTILKDSLLDYQPGKALLFQGGTEVGFTDKGLVSKGILAQNTELEYAYGKSVLLKTATEVEFGENGYLLRGTLAQNSQLPCLGGKKCIFKAESQVRFSNGYVQSGVLKSDSSLNFCEGVLITFKGNDEVTFFKNGQVEKGVIKYDQTLPHAFSTLEGNSRKTISVSMDNVRHTKFKAGTEVSFYPGGLVKTGVLLEDAVLQCASGADVVMKGNTIVCFDNRGYVNSGVLRFDSPFPFGETGSQLLFKNDTKIVLDDRGRVQNGTLLKDENLKYCKDYFVSVQGNKPVSFYRQGYIKSAVLNYNTMLPCSEKQHRYFKSGSEVVFNEKSLVTKGDIAEEFEVNKDIILKEYTPVLFNTQGKIEKGVLKYDAAVSYKSGQKVRLKAGTEITLGTDGYLLGGFLADSTSFVMLDGTNIICKPNSAVTFYPGGNLNRFTVGQDVNLKWGKEKYALFKAGTEIEVLDNGLVSQGVLKEDAELDLAAGKRGVFMAGKIVKF